MERCCKICNQVKNTPYKDMCRSCYQNKWIKSIPEKKCGKCSKPFRKAGDICNKCYGNRRNDKSRSLICLGCNRIGMIIRNKAEMLCIKCYRVKLEIENPTRAEKRKDYNMIYHRKTRGQSLDKPKRVSKGWWKTTQGYIKIYKPTHANADVNGCVNEHIFVMSESLGRPLKVGETVHHINGQRNDNRIENLELWHKSHPPGQRLQEKLDWCIGFLVEYGYHIIPP